MVDLKQAIDLIAKWEGLHKATPLGVVPYLDKHTNVKGLWTIGYGTTRYKGVRIKANHKPVTERACRDMLRYEVAENYAEAVSHAAKKPLHPLMFCALVSFVYNLGEGNLRASTLLRKVNRGDHLGVLKEFGRWNRGGGKVLRGLTLRRREEAMLYARGYWNSLSEQE